MGLKTIFNIVFITFLCFSSCTAVLAHPHYNQSSHVQIGPSSILSAKGIFLEKVNKLEPEDSYSCLEGSKNFEIVKRWILDKTLNQINFSCVQRPKKPIYGILLCTEKERSTNIFQVLLWIPVCETNLGPDYAALLDELKLLMSEKEIEKFNERPKGEGGQSTPPPKLAPSQIDD